METVEEVLGFLVWDFGLKIREFKPGFSGLVGKTKNDAEGKIDLNTVDSNLKTSFRGHAWLPTYPGRTRTLENFPSFWKVSLHQGVQKSKTYDLFTKISNCLNNQCMFYEIPKLCQIILVWQLLSFFLWISFSIWCYHNCSQ